MVVCGARRVSSSGNPTSGCRRGLGVLGRAQQLNLFSQIQLSLTLLHGASFHNPVCSIMIQSSSPRESLGSPWFQWLQQFGRGVAGGSRLRIALGSSFQGLGY